MATEYDYIVAGGGASGCVVAGRLVADGGFKVLLLEAGYSNKHPLLDMPPGIFKMINGTKFMRYHKTVEQAHLGGRVHDIPQGHVLGGGSSVNAQVYMRGRPSDTHGIRSFAAAMMASIGTGRPFYPIFTAWKTTTAFTMICTVQVAPCWSLILVTSTACHAYSCKPFKG